MKNFISLILIGALVAISSTDAQSLEYVGSTAWSTANDIDVVGNYAYCAFLNGLEILDISDPVSPAFVSRLFLEGQGQQIQLVGQYAYLTDGTTGLRIIDIFDPANPTLVGSCDTPNFAGKFAISGIYVYVTDNSPDLQIIDISNPTNPYIAGTYHGDDAFHAIAIQENYAYVGHNGISILDISYPIHPVLINEVSVYYPDDFCVEGSRIFSIRTNIFPNPADTESVFEVWDVSNPTVPDFIAADTILTWPWHDIKADGNLAYVISDNFLIIYSINYPNNPPLTRHSVTLIGYGFQIPAAISINNSLAFVIGNYSLLTINIANPDSAVFLNNYLLGRNVDNIAISGNYAYASAGFSGLSVIDVSDPVSPHEISNLYFEFAKRIIISGNYAFIGYDHGGFDIIDISDPINPVFIMAISIVHSDGIMAVSGNYFYGGNMSGISIYDITDIRNPILAGQYQQSSPDSDIAVAGHYVLAEAQDQLLVIDVSNLHQPTLVNSYPVEESYMRRIIVSGNYAYLTGQNGLSVFDFSNLPALTLVGQYQTDFDLNSIALDGSYAFAIEDIQDDIAKLLALDISNPSSPILATSIDLPYGASEVTSANGYIYVANKSALVIFRLNPTNIEEGNNLPLFTSLSQNYPNPFNATTSIKYSLAKSGPVTLSIYNLLGEKVATLYDGIQSAGEHNINWIAGGYSSGVYFARLDSKDASRNIRMVLLK